VQRRRRRTPDTFVVCRKIETVLEENITRNSFITTYLTPFYISRIIARVQKNTFSSTPIYVRLLFDFIFFEKKRLFSVSYYITEAAETTV